ncbi:MAG: hypothetical protein K6V36_17030 [Anaerolineae bacterium]|nr:hypothetical protein [Anaerolineae bacterium]
MGSSSRARTRRGDTLGHFSRCGIALARTRRDIVPAARVAAASPELRRSERPGIEAWQ